MTIAWSQGFRELIIPGPRPLLLCGMPYDHSRNVGCQTLLNNKHIEHIFYLDSDVIPPADAVLRLLAHKLPIVSGLYCRRSPPASVPVMIKDSQWVTNFVPGSMVEVDYVGAGCLLIHRTVIERMPPHRPGKPWFDWRVDMQGHLPPGECLSEDFTFNKWAKEKLGIRTFVDTSVVCKHVGLAQATYGKFTPLEYAPAA